MNKLSEISIDTFFNREPKIFNDAEIKCAKRNGLKTFQDIVDDNNRNRCKTMRSFAVDHQDSLCIWNDYFNARKILPSYEAVPSDSPIGKYLGNFFLELEEFINEINRFDRPQPNERFKTRNDNIAKIFKKIYIDGISRNDAASELTMTVERVRQINENFLSELNKHIDGSEISEEYARFKFRDEIIEYLANLRKKDITGMSFKQLKRILGAKNDNVVDFVITLLGYNSYYSYETSLIGTYAIPKDYSKYTITDCIRDLLRIMKETPLKTRESHLSDGLKRQGYSDDYINVVLLIIRHCEQIITTNLDDVYFYELKWSELPTQARVERILFENKDRALSIDEINDKYRIISNQNGTRLNSKIIFRKSKYITGANGCWRWTYGNTDVITDCRASLRRFVQDNGGSITFDAAKNYILSLNLSLKDSTIKTYLTEFCTHGRGSNVYSFKTNFTPGRGLIIEEIVKLIRKYGRAVSANELANQLNVPLRRINRNLLCSISLEIIEKDNKANPPIYSISRDWDGNFPNIRTGRKTPAYYEIVRQTAIRALQHEQNQALMSSKLFGILEYIVPDILTAKVQIINKIIKRYNDDFIRQEQPNNRLLIKLNPKNHPPQHITFSMVDGWPVIRNLLQDFSTRKQWGFSHDYANKMYNIMCNGNVLDDKSYFWLMCELLLPYLNGQTINRNEKEYLRNIICLNYEQYLRNLYELNTGRKLLTPPGLGGVVMALQSENMLWPRVDGTNISNAISHIIRSRGAIAHADVRDNEVRIQDNISEFLYLFLKTTEKLI